MQRLHGTSEEREDSQGDWRGARSHKVTLDSEGGISGPCLYHHQGGGPDFIFHLKMFPLCFGFCFGQVLGEEFEKTNI